jgi:hypothetical protein
VFDLKSKKGTDHLQEHNEAILTAQQTRQPTFEFSLAVGLAGCSRCLSPYLYGIPAKTTLAHGRVFL